MKGVRIPRIASPKLSGVMKANADKMARESKARVEQFVRTRPK